MAYISNCVSNISTRNVPQIIVFHFAAIASVAWQWNLIGAIMAFRPNI